MMLLSARGFTLVELLITVGIVGILAAIAIPSYSRYVMRSNRSQAEQLMTTIANREAQYLLDARAYTKQIGASGLNLTHLDGWTCEQSCTSSRYSVSVAIGATPGEGFTITATPSGSQVKDGVLELRSDGTRTRTLGGVNKGW